MNYGSIMADDQALSASRVTYRWLWIFTYLPIPHSHHTSPDKKVLFGTLSLWHMVCKSMNFILWAHSTTYLYLLTTKKVEALFDKMMMVCLLKMVFFMRTRRPLKWWNRWNSSKLFLPFCHQSCLVWNILMYSTITLKMGLSKQFILIWLFINWVS